VLIDVSDKVQDNDFELQPEHITTWESEYGSVPNASVVLFRFGWSSLYYDNRKAYMGFGTSNSSELNFPGKLKSIL
jgi:kynurenine formamidase